ncbi:hypothetical protein BD410DRAFT_278404 [Rickenella mellea]|uniref:Uncharacterized protein n=1 Tax=Rickenella mellea TaxID=50990 RepID=A0A4Y7Q4M0_9AGAM|nr:hypothetical protein BD410DRAFT_278404 [Rickenella mellea]
MGCGAVGRRGRVRSPGFLWALERVWVYMYTWRRRSPERRRRHLVGNKLMEAEGDVGCGTYEWKNRRTRGYLHRSYLRTKSVHLCVQYLIHFSYFLLTLNL